MVRNLSQPIKAMNLSVQLIKGSFQAYWVQGVSHSPHTRKDTVKIKGHPVCKELSFPHLGWEFIKEKKESKKTRTRSSKKELVQENTHSTKKGSKKK